MLWVALCYISGIQLPWLAADIPVNEKKMFGQAKKSTHKIYDYIHGLSWMQNIRMA